MIFYTCFSSSCRSVMTLFTWLFDMWTLCSNAATELVSSKCDQRKTFATESLSYSGLLLTSHLLLCSRDYLPSWLTLQAFSLITCHQGALLISRHFMLMWEGHVVFIYFDEKWHVVWCWIFWSQSDFLSFWIIFKGCVRHQKYLRQWKCGLRFSE